jgi:hypothetical protein
MRARVSSHARSSKFLLLNEEQNPAFDAEFHSREELETKFVLLERLNEDKPFNVLDLGGGNGVFVDQLLSRFPRSSATIVDVSVSLLEKNKPSDRKELIHDAIEYIRNLLVGRTFDYITMNWVFHHPVHSRSAPAGPWCRPSWPRPLAFPLGTINFLRDNRIIT